MNCWPYLPTIFPCSCWQPPCPNPNAQNFPRFLLRRMGFTPNTDSLNSPFKLLDRPLDAANNNKMQTMPLCSVFITQVHEYKYDWRPTKEISHTSHMLWRSRFTAKKWMPSPHRKCCDWCREEINQYCQYSSVQLHDTVRRKCCDIRISSLLHVVGNRCTLQFLKWFSCCRSAQATASDSGKICQRGCYGS